MGQPHKHAEILRAIADGKEVQYSRTEGSAWADYRKDGQGYDPLTNDTWSWRIKPERKPDVSFYARLELDNLPMRVKVMMPDPCMHNVQLTFDGETGALKSAEVLK